MEVGYLVHVLAAVVGVSALLAASTLAFTLVKAAGALYLLWLAITAWRDSRTAGDASVVAVGGDEASQMSPKPFRQGLVVGSSNPKTAIFFLAFLPQFVDPAAGPVAPQITILGLTFILLACLPDFTWALAAGRLRPRLGALKRRVVDRLSAGVYGALAVLVATVRRTAA